MGAFPDKISRKPFMPVQRHDGSVDDSSREGTGYKVRRRTLDDWVLTLSKPATQLFVLAL